MALNQNVSATVTGLTQIEGLDGAYEVTFNVTNATAFTPANATPIYVKVAFTAAGTTYNIAQVSATAGAGTEIAIGTTLGLTGTLITDDVITVADITASTGVINYFA